MDTNAPTKRTPTDSETHCEVWCEDLDGTNPRLVHIWVEDRKGAAEMVNRYDGEEADTAKTDGTPVERRYFAVEVATTRTRVGS
jgi:hypothetical protein